MKITELPFSTFKIITSATDTIFTIWHTCRAVFPSFTCKIRSASFSLNHSRKSRKIWPQQNNNQNKDNIQLIITQNNNEYYVLTISYQHQKENYNEPRIHHGFDTMSCHFFSQREQPRRSYVCSADNFSGLLSKRTMCIPYL